MPEINFDYHPQFFTATILNWQPLLKDDFFKEIIVNSLLFLKKEGSIKVYGFVIMPNHIHLIWQIQDGFKQSQVQMRLLKFTGQQMKLELLKIAPHKLQSYKVNAKDREYQIWERNSLSINLWSPAVFNQKMDYVHNNPLQDKWRLAEYPEDYRYSSASFYENGYDEFGLLANYDE
jgi:REP element-mobilizing transposase RayT